MEILRNHEITVLSFSNIDLKVGQQSPLENVWHRAFRWKTFGLMTLQLAMVLLIAVPWGHWFDLRFLLRIADITNKADDIAIYHIIRYKRMREEI